MVFNAPLQRKKVVMGLEPLIAGHKTKDEPLRSLVIQQAWSLKR
jgi:hypothetical protein